MIQDPTELTIEEERVVLQKFDGEALPENEVERVTIVNGTVIEHQVIEDGEPVGPVEEDNLEGKYVGTMLIDDKEVD